MSFFLRFYQEEQTREHIYDVSRHGNIFVFFYPLMMTEIWHFPRNKLLEYFVISLILAKLTQFGGRVIPQWEQGGEYIL